MLRPQVLVVGQQQHKKKYLDEVFIYKLLEELQKVIISTKTISGHAKNLMEQIPIGGFVQPMLAIFMA